MSQARPPKAKALRPSDAARPEATAPGAGRDKPRPSDRRARLEQDVATLREVVAAAAVAVVVVDRDLRIRCVTPAAATLLGIDPDAAVGRPLPALGPAFQRAELERTVTEVCRSGAPVRREMPVGGATYAVRISPRRAEDGVAISFRDLTERLERDRHETRLLAELDHRVKNTLAICGSIAAQTLKAAPSPEAFAEAFRFRLQALAQAHGVLARRRWRLASLRETVEAQCVLLRPGVRERVTLAGPEILLPPRATVTLSLALHELAANAARHGALSAAGGRVAVTWSEPGSPAARRIRIVWVESGGPPIADPSKRGFGRRLIEQSLAYELGGNASLDFRPDGLRCILEFAAVELSDHSGAGDA